MMTREGIQTAPEFASGFFFLFCWVGFVCGFASAVT